MAFSNRSTVVASAVILLLASCGRASQETAAEDVPFDASTLDSSEASDVRPADAKVEHAIDAPDDTARLDHAVEAARDEAPDGTACESEFGLPGWKIPAGCGPDCPTDAWMDIGALCIPACALEHTNDPVPCGANSCQPDELCASFGSGVDASGQDAADRHACVPSPARVCEPGKDCCYRVCARPRIDLKSRTLSCGAI